MPVLSMNRQPLKKVFNPVLKGIVLDFLQLLTETWTTDYYRDFFIEPADPITDKTARTASLKNNE